MITIMERRKVTCCQSGPVVIYRDIDRSSKLDETIAANLAMRHLVLLLTQGNTITFLIPEAVHRIQFSVKSLHSPMEMRPLMEKLFSQREGPLELRVLYKQFVKMHGHMAFDHIQKWYILRVQSGR